MSGALTAAGLSLPPFDEDEDKGFDPAILDTIGDIFGKVSDVLQNLDDPDICPDVDLSKVAGVAGALDAIAEIGAVVSNVTTETGQAIQEAMDKVNDRIGSIQANAGDGSGPSTIMPFVQYVFPEVYKTAYRYAAASMLEFQAYGTADPGGGLRETWSGEPISGNPDTWMSDYAAQIRDVLNPDYNVYRSYVEFDTNGDFESATISADFDLSYDSDGTNEMRLRFGGADMATERMQLGVRGPSVTFYGQMATAGGYSVAGSLTPAENIMGAHDLVSLGSTTNSGMPVSASILQTEMNLNPNISRLIGALPTEMEIGPGTPGVMWPTGHADAANPAGDPVPPVLARQRSLVGTLFPQAFVHALKGVYSYMLNKGAFSAYKLNTLNFFKDNANCLPGNVGDLLDAAGIIDQMQQEFAISACQKQEGPIQTKVKKSLQYGLINLLIQSMFVEFVTTNIVVFSAFSLEDVFNSKYGIQEIYD